MNRCGQCGAEVAPTIDAMKAHAESCTAPRCSRCGHLPGGRFRDRATGAICTDAWHDDHPNPGSALIPPGRN